jgi:hypothetical protein
MSQGGGGIACAILMGRREATGAGSHLFVASLIALLLGFTNVGAIPLFALLVLLMLVPVFYGVKTWVEVVGRAGAS